MAFTPARQSAEVFVQQFVKRICGVYYRNLSSDGRATPGEAGQLRRNVSYLASLTLTVVGGVFLGYLWLFAARRGKGWMLMGATTIFVTGLVWLYFHYIDVPPNEGNSH